MSETGDRITCPKCKANNFPSSAVCWQCGEPLPRQQAASPTPPGAQPGPPTPNWPEDQRAAPPRRDNTQTLIILGFVCAVLGFCCCPVFAIVGIILGVVVQQRGNVTGTWLIIVSSLVLVASVAWILLNVGKYLQMMQKGQFPWMPPGGQNPYVPHVPPQ